MGEAINLTLSEDTHRQSNEKRVEGLNCARLKCQRNYLHLQ
jgi:hypothetical protein